MAQITKVYNFRNEQFLCIPQDLKTDKEDFFIRKEGDIFIAWPVDDPWSPVKQAAGDETGDKNTVDS